MLAAACLIVAAAVAFAVISTTNRSPAVNPPASTPMSSEQSDRQNNSDMAPPVASGTVITTGNSTYGTMLFNDKKQAIYMWEVEESSTAKCYDDCAEAWPPVLTVGEPVATGDVKGELLGTTQRTDGTTQVTYNGHPLYYYAHEAPGEVECHNVRTHGGLWWVLTPSGDRASS